MVDGLWVDGFVRVVGTRGSIYRSAFVCFYDVHAAEVRNRWLLSASYEAAGKRANYVADVSRTLLFSGKRSCPPPQGVFSPGNPFFLGEVPPTSFFVPGDNILLNNKRSPQGSLAVDNTVLRRAATAVGGKVPLIPYYIIGRFLEREEGPG